jgi:hypothetical protein
MSSLLRIPGPEKLYKPANLLRKRTFRNRSKHEKSMKKIVKIGLIIVSGLLIAGGALAWSAHKPLPKAEQGPAADAMARRIMESVNEQAWDTTAYVKWSFPGGHDYVWNKKRGLVEVSWGKYKVIIRTDGQLVKAWHKDQPVSGKKAEKAASKAWFFFCNDSFWLNPLVKLFDDGTSRGIVQLEDGTEGLLITYNSGGVTPGDSYLWVLDEDGRPKAWQMWVGIIPIGGLKASWESWVTLSTGAVVATIHDLGIYKMELKNVAGGMTLQDIGLDVNPFEGV